MRSDSKQKSQIEKKNKSIVTRTRTPKVNVAQRKTEAIPTPIKLKWENKLELHQKNEVLHQWINHEVIHYNHILNLFKGLNNAISDIIIKKKIKIYELDRKLQNDRDKKEKEELEFKKSIELKVDSALMKANQTLENIKLMSKSKQVKAHQLPLIGLGTKQQVQLNASSTPETKNSMNAKESKHKDIDVLIKKCQDKYVSSLQVNESNMKTYFIPLSKIRSMFKDAKERLKRNKQRTKQMGNIFTSVYTNNKAKSSQMEIDSNSTSNALLSNVDLVIRLSSIISSDLFRKLYLKVLFAKGRDRKIDEESIYNAFSLWYMLNHLNEQFKTGINQSATFNSGSMVKVFNEKNVFSSFFDYSTQKVIDHFIMNHLNKYFEYLNRKSNEDDIGVINENAIFTNDFYKCYQRLISVEKIRFAKFIKTNTNCLFDRSNCSHEEINYFKNIQCISANNGSYFCNIFTK